MSRASTRPLVCTAIVSLMMVTRPGIVSGESAAVSGEKSGSAPPGYTTARTGDVHDFDYFQGAWTTHQRRLKARGVGSDEWEEFPAMLCMALYLGGMGAKGKNFHANVAIRMGYESMIDEVQELYLGGKKDEAGAAIPFELIEELSLIGPADKIRDDVAAWRESIVTTLLIAGDANTVRQAADIVLG